MSKLENPIRLSELQPRDTLIKTGVKKGDVFCDIGAGTGIFTIEAALITGSKTYAIDVSEEMRNTISDKAKKHNLNNIEIVDPIGFAYPAKDSECDFVLLCTVLHEIDDKSSLFDEIYRILKRDGKLIIIEFFKKQTPMGPPAARRISLDETKQFAEKHGFALTSNEDLGENFYIAVFEK